jgi:hypothetical protein
VYPIDIRRPFGFIGRDDRPGAPPTNVFWPGDEGQAGQFLHGHSSTWLPAALLQPARRAGRCALRDEPALGRVAAPEQGPRWRAGGRAGRGARHGDEPEERAVERRWESF